MNTITTPGKRSNYPLSVALIVLLHLALGYTIYQKVSGPKTSNAGIELKQTTKQQEKTVLP